MDFNKLFISLERDLNERRDIADAADSILLNLPVHTKIAYSYDTLRELKKQVPKNNFVEHVRCLGFRGQRSFLSKTGKRLTVFEQACIYVECLFNFREFYLSVVERSLKSKQSISDYMAVIREVLGVSAIPK